MGYDSEYGSKGILANFWRCEGVLQNQMGKVIYKINEKSKLIRG